MKLKGAETKVIDLAGQAMSPALSTLMVTSF